MLEPAQMRDLMAGNDTNPSGPQKATTPTTTTTGQVRVSFDLPDAPSRATMSARLREQEREQEDEDNLVEFLKNQGEDTPQNKKIGEWMSQIGEPVAVLGMVHDEQHAQVLSNVMQYAASRRADKVWKGKCLLRWGTEARRGKILRSSD